MASGTGLYDQEAGAWDEDVLLAVGLRPETLAPVDDRPRRGLAGDCAPRWPALADAVWWPALGDGACALVGTGCAPGFDADRPGPPGGAPAGFGADASAGSGGAAREGRLRAALTIGTSAAVRVVAGGAERARRPPGLFAYLLDPDRVVLGAARSNAGNLVDWLSGVVRLDGDLVADVVARAPGSHGLRAVPDLAGERSPDWPIAASGSIGGLRPDTTALDIAQALLEAAACGLADAVDSLEAAVEAPDGLQLVGSGRALVSSAAWRRLVADATGRPLIPSRVEEASARGAAVAALAGLGWLEPGPDGDLDGDPVTPDPDRAVAFRRLRTVSPSENGTNRPDRFGGWLGGPGGGHD
jgi:gluconokinase